ncbi:hypothetical protein NQ318_002145 [Aromia moschata]|uniref:Uncharacterized protein n=1 Tax=Aromia moschata TaxID=1265417 RepID=A0AAV8Y195_9CUCU|nr:hypothetical protein NQ318_002145 [Aromia moschata]
MLEFFPTPDFAPSRQTIFTKRDVTQNHDEDRNIFQGQSHTKDIECQNAFSGDLRERWKTSTKIKMVTARFSQTVVLLFTCAFSIAGQGRSQVGADQGGALAGRNFAMTEDF